MFQIKNLSIKLADKEILKKINLDILPGQIHALMGPNGSGKSSLALTILGHPNYNIISGEINFLNSNILDLPVEKRARMGIFLALQYPSSISVSVFTFLKEAHRVLTNLDISISDFKKLVYDAFDKVGLDHSFIYRNLNENFSGGEKKRLEIAQLLLFKPKFAILDEIDSGLDIDSIKNISQVILNLKKENPDLSILVITHYNRILNFLSPDAVHVLSNGELIESGNINLAKKIEDFGYNYKNEL